MRSNCYSMTFFDDSVIPFIRTGIPVFMLNNFVTINGLGKYKVFKRPESIEDNDNIDEVFKEYSDSTPWFGKENDGVMYLYRVGINEDSLNLTDVNDNYKYLSVKAKEDERISVLNGKIFFRNFGNGEQTALIRCEECTVVRVEKEEGLIMVELVDGKFICR